MSKAFVNEDAAAAETPLVPGRPARPSPITAGGLRKLQTERAGLAGAEDAASQARVAALDRILATVEVVSASLVEGGGAGFGCEIELKPPRGPHKTFVLVGPDEVDAAAGHITAESPVGRALLGCHEGDPVELRRGGSTQEMIVVAVRVLEDSEKQQP